MNEKNLIIKALKDEKFKKKLLANPKKAIEEEFKITLPKNVEIQIVEETPDKIYLVLPYVSKELSEKEFELIAGGGSWDCGSWRCVVATDAGRFPECRPAPTVSPTPGSC